MKNQHVIAVGEFLWDRIGDTRKLGGAPANVLCHLSTLGVATSLVSGVGRDELGTLAIDELKKRGVNMQHVSIHDGLDTGVVDVFLNEDRSHSFTIHMPSAWDLIELNDDLFQSVQSASALIYGTLGQRTEYARKKTAQLIDAAGPETLKVFDANLRPPYDDIELLEQMIERSDMLKINEEEFMRIAHGATPQEFFHAQANLRYLVYTKGEDGAEIHTKKGVFLEDGKCVEVVDSVGAGDSFTAAVIYGILNNIPFPVIVRLATEIAAYVCTQEGATPNISMFKERFQKFAKK